MSSDPPLDVGQAATFVIAPKKDIVVDSIGLRIGTYMRVNHGNLTICVKSSITTSSFCSASIDRRVCMIINWPYTPSLKSFPVRAGEKLLFTVKDHDSPVRHSKGQVAFYVAEGLSSPVAYTPVKYKCV